MSKADLKPCPFCGGKARLNRDRGTRGIASPCTWYREHVKCQTNKCSGASGLFKYPGGAIAAWNCRATGAA